MVTKRQMIENLRNKLRERNADSNYSNQFLYQVLVEHAKWLIKREIKKGIIYSNSFFFKPLKCQKVIEVPIIDECCPIKTNCKIYRTECKIPDIWIDDGGPVVYSVDSVDGSTNFFITTPSGFSSRKDDPYVRKIQTYYTFYADGYFWFPEHNPHLIDIVGFWVDDVTQFNGCGKKECVRFLDTAFIVPPWVEAELLAKALEQLAGVSKRLPEDEQVDKNPTRKS